MKYLTYLCNVIAYMFKEKYDHNSLHLAVQGVNDVALRVVADADEVIEFENAAIDQASIQLERAELCYENKLDKASSSIHVARSSQEDAIVAMAAVGNLQSLLKDK
jgi:hypothetical protein